MLSSNNKDYIKKAKKLSTQAKEDEIHYEHKDLGYNYRLSNVLAAIGRAQLKTLNERILIKEKYSINIMLNSMESLELNL